MGGDSSQENKAILEKTQNTNIQAYIHTDKPNYLIGQTISGIVYIMVNKNFPGSSINLYLTGNQFTRFIYYVYVGHGKHRRREQRTAVGAEQIFDHSFVLTNFFDRVISVGHYSIPFKIKTPQYIPGSYKRDIVNGQYTGANISYILTLTTFPEVPGVSNIISNQNIEIHQVQLQGSSAQTVISMYPNYCCCFKQGAIKVKCHIDLNVLVPDTIFNVYYQIDATDSLMQVQRVEIRLVQTTSLGSKEGKFWRNQLVIYKTQESGVLRTQTVRNVVKIPIPSLYSGSITGKLINVSYNLEIEPMTSDNCCLQGILYMIIPLMLNPKVKLKSPNVPVNQVLPPSYQGVAPLGVYPDIVHYEPIIPVGEAVHNQNYMGQPDIPIPPNWNPQVYPLVNFQAESLYQNDIIPPNPMLQSQYVKNQSNNDNEETIN